MPTNAIEKLLDYAQARGLMEESDRIFAYNQILDMLRLDAPAEIPGEDGPLPETATGVLAPLVAYAVARGIIGDTVTERELFDTRLMGALLPRPSQIRKTFMEKWEKEGARAATEWFYGFNRACNYIRVDQVAKNIEWQHESAYGPMTVTINLSKPEKDPKEIAKLKNAPKSGYPACMLCKENEGYAGRMNFPARQSLRTIPLTLGGEDWFMQYSPYVYYPQHCIVFKGEHTPMKVCRASFNRLLEFVTLFPHYFIGSNAGLPVVGGSILNHDHFQGGCYELPMASAGVRQRLAVPDFPGLTAWVLDWPMTCIRVRGRDRQELLEFADRLHEAWWNYADASCHILDHDADGTPHNTFSPIARRRGEDYEMDLVLRNNVCTEELPLGLYHPHPQWHHIKKENIGLIEVQGLFILPGRLQKELGAICDILSGKEPMPADIENPEHPLNKHLPWLTELQKLPPLKGDALKERIRREVGVICEHVLEDCAVFANDEAGRAGLERFLEKCNIHHA